MKTVAIIPARLHSTRLPAKPLMKIAGQEMILHVARRAAEARSVDEVRIATDDRRIAEIVGAAGFAVDMTWPDHPSGTDRIAEVAEKLDADLIVNVQGDEPLIPAENIDEAVAPFERNPDLLMGTIKTRLRDPAQLFNPNCVKVATDEEDYALYFSRSPIPFVRDGMNPVKREYRAPARQEPVFYKHIGIYVYRREFLLRFARMKPGMLELAENLEQLRALEAGVRIKVPTVESDTISVDTADDLERVRKVMES